MQRGKESSASPPISPAGEASAWSPLMPRLRFSIRNRHVPRSEHAFGLYLPGVEMMHAASLHFVHENERQTLFEHLVRLQSDDLLLLDRGYPARWPIAVLNQRPLPDAQRHALAVDVSHLQGHHFAGAQTGAVGDRQRGLVLEVAGRLD